MASASELTHVAFLRAMNTGNRRITNDELVGKVSEVGLDPVAAYQASGNVLFGGASTRSSRDWEVEIERHLETSLGYEVPTMVRTADELRHIVAIGPERFGPLPDGAKPQVAICKNEPSAEIAEQVLAHSTDADQLAIDGRELFWRPTEGVSTSDLDVRAIEELVGPMTIRTFGSIERITAKLS